MSDRVSLTGDIDPDGKAKDERELSLAELLGISLEEQYLDLISRLERDNPQDPGDTFWEPWLAALLALLVLSLRETAETGAEAAMLRLGVGVDWDEVLSEASNWAGTYSFSLVRDIVAKDQAALQEKLQQYFNGQLDFDGLVKSLESRFGPVRATNIAITETARGWDRGLDIYEDALNRQGILTDRLWFTLDDGGVCNVCRPNHLRLRSQGWTTSYPAHPRERCWTAIVIL
ncbi:MAG TPA: hypothetical protein VJ085_10960 [Candidatus Acidoferrales bacterium]|nr:hypothetical protein [Candidatus Acidoferrales bacterium]